MRKNEKNREKGITLIALVVTVIILLVLAGISIAMLTGENGIISNAKHAKKDHQIGEEQERLEMIRTEKYFKYGGELTLEKFIEELKNDEIIEDNTESGDGSFITDKGFIATIEDENGKIKITVEGVSGTKLPVVIKNINTITTSSSIKVDIEVKRGKEAIYKYYIKEKDSEDSSYELKGEGKDLTSHTITSLEKDKTYTIKVVANDSEAEIITTARTIDFKLQEGIISIRDLTWDETTHTASVKIINSEPKYGMKYIITEEETIVKDYTEIENDTVINGLELNQTIKATLWDGTNLATGTATLTIKDNIVPNKANISFSSTEAIINTNIIATVSLSDSQSGVDLSKCRWVFNTDSSETIEESLYNNTISTEKNAEIILSNNEIGEYYLHILTVDKAGNKSQTTSNVPVIFSLKAPNSSSVPNSETTLFSTSYGKIDVIWLDTNNNVISTPNSPIITANGESMTPVIFNESTSSWDNTVVSNSNWYNYEENKWANAKTKNNSYFVWIPRFAYRITYYASNTSTTPTGYYDGWGMWRADDTAVKYALDSGIETVKYNGNKYIVHPAFETNLDNGGWSSELSGFWFAKFEMGGSATNLDSTYGTESLCQSNIGQQYTTARQATYGYVGTVDQFDGQTSYMNSHMCKNSEWGAVAYLAHSKYGRNGTEITVNSSLSYAAKKRTLYKEGIKIAYVNDTNRKDIKIATLTADRIFYRGGGTNIKYIENKNQSTTGNVYGIYDMSGSAYDGVAVFNSVDDNNYLSTNGWTTATGLTISSSSTKYATKYNNISNKKLGNTVIYNYGKIGDATKEVNIGGANKGTSSDEYKNWFSDYSYIICSGAPFLNRGGCSLYSSSSNFGIFAMETGSGYYTTLNSGNLCTFYSVLCP